MPYSVSSWAIVMLLASTSTGERAALAAAMALIMSVKPGPSVPDAAAISPVTRQKPWAAWANSPGILIGLFSAVSAAFALFSPNAITVVAPAPAIALVMNLLLETSGPVFLALFLLSVLSIASPGCP